MSVTVNELGFKQGNAVGIIAQVILISVVAMIGWNIALPGLDPAFMETQLRNGVPSQLSVLALGTGPILTAFALGQIGRILVPGLENSAATVILENVVALLIAVSQAYGIAQSVATMGFLADDSAFGLGIIVASLIGGVAVLLFMSRLVALPSLLAGFWIVWLLPALIGLPAQLSSWFELLRMGAVGVSHLLGAILVMTIAAAMIIFAICTVMQSIDRQHVAESVNSSVHVMNIIIWPPFLAASAGGYLLIPLVFLSPDSLADASWLRIYVLAMTALLIPVFVFGYYRFFRLKGIRFPVPAMLVLVVVQIALMLGGELVVDQIMLPLPLNGTTLLVMVAVGYAIIDAVRRPSAPSQRTIT
jgi:preprotein translocase subunit SecY